MLFVYFEYLYCAMHVMIFKNFGSFLLNIDKILIKQNLKFIFYFLNIFLITEKQKKIPKKTLEVLN